LKNPSPKNPVKTNKTHWTGFFKKTVFFQPCLEPEGDISPRSPGSLFGETIFSPRLEISRNPDRFGVGILSRSILTKLFFKLILNCECRAGKEEARE